jgi:hypothetical protein
MFASLAFPNGYLSAPFSYRLVPAGSRLGVSLFITGSGCSLWLFDREDFIFGYLD